MTSKKKKIRKYLCILFSVLILLNCGAIAIADPIDTTTTTTALGYEEYFAEDRTVYVDNILYPYAYIAKTNGLYEVPRSTPDAEPTLVYRESIKSSFIHNNLLFYTSAKDGEKTIYRYDVLTKKKSALYTSDSSISRLDGNADTIFFLSGNNLCRLYVPTGQVDLISPLPERFDFFQIASNNRVIIYVLRQDWIDYVNRTHDEENCPYEMNDVYMIDARQQTTTQITVEAADQIFLQLSAQTLNNETNAVAATASRPANFLYECILPAYNVPASAWPNDGATTVAYTKTYKASSNCVAFALTVYDTVFYPQTLNSSIRYCDQNGEKLSYSTANQPIASATDAKNRIYSYEPGSIIAVRDKHWIILAGYDSVNVWVYHSNLHFNSSKNAEESDRNVRLHYMTYQQFKDVMKKTRYVYHSKYNTSHTHSYSGVQVDVNGHDLRCTRCSVRKANSYTEHSYTPYHDGTEYFEICTICGYEMHF